MKMRDCPAECGTVDTYALIHRPRGVGKAIIKEEEFMVMLRNSRPSAASIPINVNLVATSNTAGFHFDNMANIKS